MELATNSRVVLHQPDNFTIVRLQRVTAIVRMSVGMLARRRSTLLAAESWTRGIRGDEIPVYQGLLGKYSVARIFAPVDSPHPSRPPG